MRWRIIVHKKTEYDIEAPTPASARMLAEERYISELSGGDLLPHFDLMEVYPKDEVSDFLLGTRLIEEELESAGGELEYIRSDGKLVKVTVEDDT